MTSTSRFLLRLARCIAGPERGDWIDAMEAEAAAANGASTTWAIGCLWASIKDRLARDWWFPAVVLLLPVIMFWWKSTIFFATNDMVFQHRIPAWLAVSCWVLSPFPLAFLIALWRREKSAYLAVALAFILVESFPLLMMWRMGVPLGRWFGPNVNWYKFDPDIRIGLLPGITLDLLAWIAAVWLGSTLRRKVAR